MLSSKNFATMATWGNDFSSLSREYFAYDHVKFGILGLESGTQLEESGIPLTIEECGIEFLESGINAVESRMQDCLDYLICGAIYNSYSLWLWLNMVECETKKQSIKYRPEHG